MVATHSTMLPLGTQAPDFSLKDTTGKTVSLFGFRGSSGLVVAFICNHCPYVKHVRSELARIGREYQAKGIGFVGINSNDPERYPADGPDNMAEESKLAGYTFPYLFDSTQDVAKRYKAACTPDLFVFDRDLRLFYRGQLDDSRPGNGLPVTGKDLRNALELVLAGKPAPASQKASIGCNIKWKPGNEPDYF